MPLNKLRQQSQYGFTLVELSIVLVILGLLVGGVLTGQSLIRAAELRSITADMSKYLTATNAFKDKYFALPGDMTNATQFWGVLAGTGSDTTCHNTTATSNATCNGDGDGSLLATISGTTYSSYENFRYWQHLANAGLIEGQYTGVGTGASTSLSPGTNVPVSKFSRIAFWPSRGLGYAAIGSTTYFAGSTSTFAGDYGRNQISITSPGASGGTAGSMALRPEDAWNIDMKVDDGAPGTGTYVSYKGNATLPCTDKAGLAVGSDAGAVYNFANKSTDCSMYVVRIF